MLNYRFSSPPWRVLHFLTLDMPASNLPRLAASGRVWAHRKRVPGQQSIGSRQRYFGAFSWQAGVFRKRGTITQAADMSSDQLSIG